MSHRGEALLCYHDWITENFASLSIPSGFTHKGIVEQIAKGATKTIPIAYLSAELAQANPSRGRAVFGRPGKYFDEIASAHDLGWWITEKGLWMDRHPPGDLAYANADGSLLPVERKGRPAKRPQDFAARAGDLWRTAMQATGTKVSAEHLRQIASELDSSHFLPPADYLEQSVATLVRRFNTANSNSKRGPIKTWSKLIEYGDKDHLRGMRRLLSRCARNRSRRVRKEFPDKKQRPPS